MTINTIKFSEFANGGDLANDEITVGLDGGVNTSFNNPWTFLRPGATGDRPTPAAPMYYRLRFNTTLEIYEYYDPTIPIWVELSGSGTGAVNPGVANDIAFYAASGQAISPIAGAANAVLVSNASKVPSMSTTLPIGLSIPGAAITASTAALLSGSVVAAPVAGTDITNKTYVDGLVSGAVTSITGTTNQVIVSSPTGAVTLSLPQDIATGSDVQFNSLTLSTVGILDLAGHTLLATVGTIGATNHISVINQVAGAAPGFIASGETNTDFNLQTTGTGKVSVVTESTIGLNIVSGTGYLHATRFNFANTANARDVTFPDVTGTVALLDANNNLSANAFITGFATTVTAAGTTTLTVASRQTQEFTGATTQTVVMPVTSTLVAGMSYTIINNSSGALTVNSSGANLILTMAANTSAIFTCVLNSGTTAASWNASYIVDAGGGVSPGTINQLAWYSATGNVVSGLATANSGVLVTSAGGVPSISSTLPSGIAATNMVLTTPTIVTKFNDTNGHTILGVELSTNAVNNLSVLNADTGVTPELKAAGTDPNIGLNIRAKAAGVISLISQATTTPLFIYNGTSSQHTTALAFANTAASRTVTFPDADGTIQFVAGAGGLKSFQVFTSGTAATYTRPAGITSILVEVCGGGGGGAGSLGGASTYAAGGGGSAGGYAWLWIPSSASTYTYTIGGGGNGGVAGSNAGSTGGTTTFSASSLQATGGLGGQPSVPVTAATGTLGPVAASGVGTNGTINTAGTPGSPGIIILGSAISGNGGSNIFGGGAVGKTSGAGNNGGNYGAGGAGGASTTVSAAGGNGSAGVIIVWEFA